jgi:hypothetical protein
LLLSHHLVAFDTRLEDLDLLVEELVRLLDLKGELVPRVLQVVLELISDFREAARDGFHLGDHHVLEIFALLRLLIQLSDRLHVELDAREKVCETLVMV